MFRYKFLCLIPALVHRRWREVLAALLHPHRVWRRPAGAGGGAGVGGGGGSRRRRTTTWSSARSWSRALLAARTRERSKMHGTSVSQRKRGAQLGQKQEARGLHRCRAFDAHNVICAVVSWHSARPPTARCCRGSGDARPRPRARQRAAGHWSGWRRGPTACCIRRRGPTRTRRRRRLPSCRGGQNSTDFFSQTKILVSPYSSPDDAGPRFLSGSKEYGLTSITIFFKYSFEIKQKVGAEALLFTWSPSYSIRMCIYIYE